MSHRRLFVEVEALGQRPRGDRVAQGGQVVLPRMQLALPSLDALLNR
jgi:hypothetical protein